MDKAFDSNSFNDLALLSGKSQGMNQTFAKIVEQFSYQPHIRTSHNLALFPVQDDVDDYQDYQHHQPYKREVMQPSAFLADSIFAKKIRQGVYNAGVPQQQETIESQLSGQTGEFDLNSIMNSGRLMRLKLDMGKFPDRGLDLQEFVITMKQVIQQHVSIDEQTLISHLMDNFYRIDMHNTGKVSFQMVSSYMIEQEFMAEMNKEKALLYHLSPLVDESRHDNFVDKIFYYASFDKLGVMEQNMRTLKIYNSKNLKLQHTMILKNGIALASEYIQEFHVLALTSSDKSMLIINAYNYAIMKKIMTPQSQHTMFWSHTHQILFTAGMQGKVYGWVMDEILNPQRKHQQILYTDVVAKGMPWKDGDECIFNIVELIAMNQIATACADSKIRIWDIKWEKNYEPRKLFDWHNRAVKALAYSQKYNLLISAGFQFDALVWNPYVPTPICHLKGHEAPLVGVECPEVNPTIITGDSKGIIKVWNIRDYSLIQTFYVPNVLNLKAIKCVPKHRRLLAASRKIQVFDYQKPFVSELSDDSPIFCACYSSQQLQIFIAGQYSIKVWNASTGRPIKLISDIFSSEITFITLDETDRKIIVGDHSGRIIMVDSLSGVVLKEFCRHQGQITGLCYVPVDRLLISSSWDRQILIHNDSLKLGYKQKHKGVVRTIKNAHSNDIICLTYSRYLDLILSGSRDCQVRLWDYQTCKLQGIILGHRADILVIKSLDPYPLILIGDQSGSLSLWGLGLQGLPRMSCLCKWRNMHTLQKTATITSVSYYYQEQSLHLILGDQKGTIRILDVTDLLQQLNIRPLAQHIQRNTIRNPTRLADIDMEAIKPANDAGGRRSSDSIHSDIQTGLTELEFYARPLKQDHFVRQIVQWKAHKDAIKFLSYIDQIQNEGILSAGLDNMCSMWSLNGELLGVLKQGSRTKHQWNFSLKPEVISRKYDKAREIIMKIKHLPSETRKVLADQERSFIKRLNTNLIDRAPTTITKGEMMKNITEVNRMLPKDDFYESRKDARMFKPKKGKRK